MITQADQDARVRGEIRRAPNIRADEIAARLGWDVASVSASLRRLKVAGQVQPRGNTRATTYTVWP